MSSLHFIEGLCFSMGTLFDCQFATIATGFFPEGSDIFAMRRGVGFITFEGLDGSCYYYYNDSQEDFVDANIIELIFNAYMDFLTESWTGARAFAMIAPGLGWLTWLYMLSYSCSAQLQFFRYGTGVILSVLLVIFQGLTFLVFGTEWCSDKSCELSRSGGLSIGALFCYFFAGITFFLTKDFPGPKEHENNIDYADATKGVVEDEEQPAGMVVEDEQDASIDGVLAEQPLDQEGNVEASIEDKDNVEVTNELVGGVNPALKGSDNSPSFSA